MTFTSILFDQELPPANDTLPPACFSDLHLDHLVERITAHKDEYGLKPFFYTLPAKLETILYRQEIVRDLQQQPWLAQLKAFATQMAQTRRYLAMIEKLDFELHRQGWFLEAALAYCQAINNLQTAIETTQLQSRGFQALRDYLLSYTQSAQFQALAQAAQAVKTALSQVRYTITIQSGRFSVRRYEGEGDYSVQVEQTFEKFRQGKVKNYYVEGYDSAGMNHIQAKILEFVARLYPEPFALLAGFCQRYATFVDDTLLRFDREVQFYISYLDYLTTIEHKGLPFCLPEISEERDVFARETFDIALAGSLALSSQPVICNDFEINPTERVIVVTGPNQGGKTTFARTFGQIHYLANLGLLVPGRTARLFHFDRIFTHFEREEELRNLSGKLQDDLQRIHHILQTATSRSVIILNEIFSSTTLEDALFLSREIMARLLALDALEVWVTFLDELASFNEKTISMVSTVSPENPAERTFRIIRKPADGLAYALSLAEKHRLTYEQLKQRIQP
ncbi:MAG: DNA mismatch repair protein MutS [Anaerolineae bacterium]|nr:MAG: DNA mismatch repair protein MutS [Anaerolineae bacterium]